MATLLLEKIIEQYPDFKEIVDIFNDMVAQHHEDTAHIEDNQKTPFLLLLAVLYRYQRRYEPDLLIQGEMLDKENGEEVEMICSKFWWVINTVGHSLRRGIASATVDTLADVCEENRILCADELGLTEDDLVMTWVSEMDDTDSLESHCPDFSLSIDREQQCLVVTLLGTRITPTPKIHDIIMDLRAETQPFLGGEGHAGMVIGAQNLLAKTLDKVVEVLSTNPDLSLLVIGYSLGAGLAQLYTALLLEEEEYRDRIPSGTKIRCLAYGAPPVFKQDGVTAKSFKEIFVVQNNKDGVIGASIRSVNDLFNKIVAIDGADIDQQSMLKIIFGKTESNEEEDTATEDNSLKNTEELQENEVQSSSFWGMVDMVKDSSFMEGLTHKVTEYRKSLAVDETVWSEVGEALEGRKVDVAEHLTLLGSTVLHMKNKAGNVEINRFSGINQTRIFTKELRLYSGMFNDHMPWGYSQLFQGRKNEKNDVRVKLSCLDKLEELIID